MALFGWFSLEKQVLSTLSIALKLKFTGTFLAHIACPAAIKIKYRGEAKANGFKEMN